MNVMTRLYNNRAVRLPLRQTHRAGWSWGTQCLIGLLILSAFAVVYLKDLNRRTFIQYQNKVRDNQQARVEWGKLLLEQSTWSAQANIQQTAAQRLGMITPNTKDIIFIGD